MFTRGYQVFPISSPTVFGESGAHPKNCTIHDDPRHPREVGVTHAFCPHMGAHLGMGGVVVGNSLQCPFHGWSFNVAGMVWKTSAQCRGYSHWQLGKRRKRGLTHGFGAALFSDKPRYIPISVGIKKLRVNSLFWLLRSSFFTISPSGDCVSVPYRRCNRDMPESSKLHAYEADGGIVEISCPM